jgi:hypothetical protein
MMDMEQHDLIERVARELYMTNGKIEGRDLDNWLEAESIVRGWSEGYEDALFEEDFHE